jgi:hypothetical protein
MIVWSALLEGIGTRDADGNERMIPSPRVVGPHRHDEDCRLDSPLAASTDRR